MRKLKKLAGGGSFSLRGFTLIEIIIVISVIAILASAVILANVKSAYEKTRDSKRKQDLNKMVRSLEDYYNDNQHYPPANNPGNGRIAGSPWGSPLGNYAAELPKDPLSPGLDYYYQAGSGNKFFILYARLENTSDPDIERVGCQNGCGPMATTGYRAFNYFVSSGDVIIAYGFPNGEDPGALPGAPTATPMPTIAGSPTPIPYCGPDIPANICCVQDECCRAPKYCGFYQGVPQQCPGANNYCFYNESDGRYECTYDMIKCP